MILLVLLVAIVMLTYKAPRLSYELTPEESLNAIQNQEYFVSVEEASAINDENTVFVDIRNSGDFFVKHIDGAVNIPLIKLLDEESLKLFETDGKNFILYGENHLMANGPWLVLKQLGFENIKLLVGGFQNFQSIGQEYPAHYLSFDEIEKAEFDLLAEIKKASEKFANADSEAGAEIMTSTKSPVKRKPTPAPVIPIEEEEEEDEGC